MLPSLIQAFETNCWKSASPIEQNGFCNFCHCEDLVVGSIYNLHVVLIYIANCSTRIIYTEIELSFLCPQIYYRSHLHI